MIMNATPLLTVFFDGHCALCSAEMAEIRAMDATGEIRLVDAAAEGLDDAEVRAAGITQAELMTSLHVRDALGDWHRGVDAIALVYATAGAPWLAHAWAHPLTRPFTRRLYPWLVRHRHRLSVLGLHVVAPKALRLFSRRHGAHAPAYCTHGGCRTAPHA
jgi:predicted DCC family thiol-disulfide oxidoreductase YuxK